MLALTIREKSGEERQLIFDKEEVTIGRATGSDIVLPRSNISKRHARLVDKHDKVVIVDLRSTNGTYVNGRRITAPELLTYDDKVYIGDFVIRLSKPSEQHPSQRMTAPYSASPTPLGDGPPRTARAATQAVDPPGADFYEEDSAPIAAPPGPPPMDLDDDASTRAIDASLAAQIDDDAPPPPKKAAAPAPAAKAAVPKVPEPKPAASAPSATPLKRETPAASPLVKKEPAAPAPTHGSVAKKEAPPTPAAPAPRAAEAKPMPAKAPPPRPDDGATILSLEKMKKPVPPPPPEPEPLSAEPSVGELDGWAQWNAMLTTLVERVEVDHPDGVDVNEAQDIVESALAQAIESGAIAAETDRGALVADALSELVGLGALADVEHDNSVRLVVANGPKAVFVDRGAGVLEPNGRVFATTASYRRALGYLAAAAGHRLAGPDGAVPGVEEVRLADGSMVRVVEPGAGSDPLLVWRRPASDAPSLVDLVADRFLDTAQEKELSHAAAAGKSIVVAGPHANVLAAAIASTWPFERRIVAVGDGTRVALTHPNVARVGAAALTAASNLLALEPDALVFEALDGRAAYLWMEASLTAGRPVVAVSNEATGDKALKRLALVLELQGVPGRGAALVGEAVDLVVTTRVDADGTTKVDRIEEVEAQKDGFTLKAKSKR